MLRWLAACVALCALAFVAVAAATKTWPHIALMQLVGWSPDPRANPDANAEKKETDSDLDKDSGIVLVADPRTGNSSEAVIIYDARVAATEFQEVPCERDGQLLFVAGELLSSDDKLREQIRLIVQDNKDARQRQNKLAELGLVEEKLTYLGIQLEDGSEVKSYADLKDGLNFQFKGDKTWHRRWDPDRPQPPLSGNMLVTYTLPEQMKKLQVGDRVTKGQRLALVKPDLAAADLDVKVSKLKGTEADRESSQKTLVEFETRLEYYRRNPGAVTPEDLRAAELQVVRYKQEVIQKEALIEQAKSELRAALTTLRLHDVRARISGVVRTIYKNPGDSVKHLEAVLRIENPDNLRVEGKAEVQEGRKLQIGMPVVIEATRPDSPMLVLTGHMQEVHGVAVCAGPGTQGAVARPVIISGSEDKKLCLWDVNGVKQWEVKYSTGVRAVACTPPAAEHRYIAAGTADGAVRLLDLDHIDDVLAAGTQDFSHMVNENSKILTDRAVSADSNRAHTGAVTCIAFSPDGKLVATGGEDYSIALWDVSSGNLVGRVTKAHKQAVTSLQMVKSVNEHGQPVVRMLSAGRDAVLTLWTLREGKNPSRDRDFDRRSGDVGLLTSDGKRFLFDQGKELRLLSLTNGQLDGMLQNPPTAGSFTTLAMFAPDGQTILTNGTGETGLQLWRAPDNGGRGSEVRQFMWSDGHATCAAFAPDGSFAVTGTNEDHQVLVWKMPSKEEVQTPLYGKVSLVEATVESGSKHVRVWADLDKKPEWLLPGTKARMVIIPSAR